MANEIVFDEDYMALLEGEGEAIPDFDADAEYALPAPPIPDGTYFGIVELGGMKDKEGNRVPFIEKQWPSERSPHFEIAVKATLTSDIPAVNGKMVFTPLLRPLTTVPDPKRNNTSGVAWAYRCITGQPIKGVSQKEHAKQFVTLLQSSPSAQVKVRNILEDWEYDRDERAKDPTHKGKKVYGQKAIMALPKGTNSDGSFSGRAEHPVSGNLTVAKANIDSFEPKVG